MAEFTFTDAQFDQDVLKASGLVMVDFFAEWCGPCKMMAPIIDRLSKAYEGKVKIGKLDVDANGETSQRYEIQSIPTIVFFRDGQVVDKLVGFQSEEALKQKMDALLS